MCVQETERWVVAQKDLTQRWKTFFSVSHRHKHVKSLEIQQPECERASLQAKQRRVGVALNSLLILRRMFMSRIQPLAATFSTPSAAPCDRKPAGAAQSLHTKTLSVAAPLFIAGTRRLRRNASPGFPGSSQRSLLATPRRQNLVKNNWLCWMFEIL